jgi:hypothetical protein
VLACQPDSHVRRTFSLAGVETLLSLHPSRQEALEQALR